MKARTIMMIVIAVFAGFVIWSMTDTVCKPCAIPSDVTDYYCPSICVPEPRWQSWMR